MRYYLTAVLLALSAWAHANILGQPIATDLFEASDIVCSGTVTALKDTRPAEKDLTGRTVHHLLATVLIDDLYKGNLPADRSIFVEFATRQPDYPEPGLSPGEHALLFLKGTEDRTFAFANKQFGGIQVSSIPVEPGSDGPAKFEAAMVSVFVDGKPTDRVYAAELLLSSGRLAAASITKISPAAMAADPTLAQYAIALLIKWDTPQGLEQLKRLIQQDRVNTSEASTMEALVAVMGELSSVKDERYLNEVEGLSFSDNLGIRMGAMQALRNMETKAAAPAFVKHLDDPDKHIRYSAMMALATMYGEPGPQTPDWREFDRNPDYYTDLWKSWARQTVISNGR